MDEKQIIELLTKFCCHLIDTSEDKIKIRAIEWWDKNKHIYEAKKLTDIDFIQWYSGMDEEKIKSAFIRYNREIEQGQP